MEGAGASLDYRHLLSFMAPATAHQVAAVDADARVVALPPLSAQDAEFGIFLTERRRRLYIDEIFLPGRFMLRIVRLQLEVVAMSASETVTMLVYGVACRIARDGIVANARAV